MLIEAESIPYEPVRLRGERLLILAPHPDDEVIGCGGLLAQHLRENRPVRVVVATDGVAASETSDPEAYRNQREHECRQGISLLGGEATVEFLRFADRGLGGDVADVIGRLLAGFAPDLICVPSPIEIHPDHLALSRNFCELIQRDTSLFADLAPSRVAFYEVGQPLRPNALVDITDVADVKYAAIAEHLSQLSIRDYVGYARGLNAYRAMTLPPSARYAEAYFVIGLPELRTTAFGELRARVGNAPEIEITRSTLPVTVVIRTKDRPALLREAIDSVRANDHPAKVVVVNDGGAVPEIDEHVTLVNHETPLGRSAAMNRGVEAATTDFIAFLDDDDLYYPEHLSTLTGAAEALPSRSAWYTDAVSVFMTLGAAGKYEERARLRLFEQDYDADLLLADNYIPLPTLLVRRADFLALHGFDPGLDLFEDWEFLIRLSHRGPLQRIPRVTCEIRHFEGGASIILAAPEGSEEFRRAKLQVWRKHAAFVGNELFARVIEKQKRLMTAANAAAVEEKGRRALSQNDINRLERDKNQLIAELQAMHSRVTEKMVHIGKLEGEVRAAEAESERVGFEKQTAEKEHEKEREQLRGELTEARHTLNATFAEIDRLQRLLNMIYGSRTWKMHTMLEKMRGRG